MELGFNYLVFGAAPNGRAVRRGSVRFGAHREFSPDVRRDPRTTKPIVNCRRFAVDDRVHGRESEVPCRRRGLTGVQNRRTYSVTERPGLFFFPQKTSIGRCDRKETSENGRKKKIRFFRQSTTRARFHRPLVRQAGRVRHSVTTYSSDIGFLLLSELLCIDRPCPRFHVRVIPPDGDLRPLLDVSIQRPLSSRTVCDTNCQLQIGSRTQLLVTTTTDGTSSDKVPGVHRRRCLCTLVIVCYPKPVLCVCDKQKLIPMTHDRFLANRYKSPKNKNKHKF